MPTSSDFRKLTDAEWNQLQERADQFADAVHAGKAGDWDAFLNGLPANLRGPVLHEMVKIDLDHRWSKGERPLLEEYAARHEEIGDVNSFPVDLICEEYRIRKRRGQDPDIDDYFGRFPEQYAEVKQELDKNPTQSLRSGRMGETNASNIGMVRTEAARTEAPGTQIGASLQLNTIVASETQPKKPTASQAPPVTSQGGMNFEKIEMLGHGNFGEVWKAKAEGGIEVAVKVVTQPIDRDAAQREFQALELVKNLRHPCLLSTHRFWFDNNRLHIAMELADGSLRDRFKQCKKQNLPGIPRDELIMYFADAAEGLDFLHLKKVFHRDVKPDNIMLLHGHAKVADFGLARLQERQMMTVSFAGTPVYMSPEAWAGKGGPNSDQYSLAFAYVELRQGRRPIEGSDFTEVMAKTIEGDLQMQGIPPEEAKVLKKALAKKPEDRFANCSEFVAALARATGNPVRLRSPIEANLQKIAGGDGESDGTFKESYKGSEAPTLSHTPVPGTGPAAWSAERPKAKKAGAGKFVLAAVAMGLLVGGGIALWSVFFKGGTPTTSESKVADSGDKDKDKDKDRDRDKFNGTDPKPKPKDKEVDFLPAKFDAAAGSNVISYQGKKLHTRIDYPLKNGDKATFVLVRPTVGKPFYMMENKVWNAFFKEFADDNPTKIGKPGWPSNAPPKQPAMQVSVSEAHQFALSLGGLLPTTNQWDEAASLNNRAGRAGPSLKAETAAVGRSEPRAIDDPVKDVSNSDINDLGGNGREWTRDLLAKSGPRTVPLDAPTATDVVILRGRNYTLQKPLTYSDLDYESKVPQTQLYLKTSPYTGFRVVIELPD